MAGEIEEPFRLDFQAHLLQSGSISFGRFESESLSWERRSIFSHNRYLEEVEKYSKPGTVTEKKAYFEAEFKRKALLKQRSSECQDQRECPTVRTNDLHDFEESGSCNQSHCSSNPSKCNTETEVPNDENGDVACCDEGALDLVYGEDTTSQHYDSQNYELYPVTTPHQSASDNVAGNTKQSIGMTHVDHVVVDMASNANDDSSVPCQTPEKDHGSMCPAPQTKFFPKVKPAAEKKHTMSSSAPKTRINADRSQKQVPNGGSKGSMKPRTTESKGLLVKKTEKKSTPSASPLLCSGVKTSKPQELNSDKAVKVKARISLSDNSLPGVRLTANRSNQAVNPSKTHLVQSTTTGSGLKNDQRAERRKEEKQSAAVEMKQFRKSLNFKAKPLPSFYNQSAHGSDQHKIIPISKTPNQPRPRSQAMATRHDKNPFKTPNQPRPRSQAMATRNDKNPFKSSVPSNTRPRSSTPSTNRVCLSDHVPEKKDKEKGKVYKQKDLEVRGG